jgi:peroxiredoxin family protein
MAADPEPAGRTPFGPDKLSLVVFSGDFQKVHYALVLAASAAAIGRAATLFFTMQACRTMLAPAADGTPAWRTLPAGGDAGAAGQLDDCLAARGIAGFEELLSSCVQLGVRFLVCETGLRAMDLTLEVLRRDVPWEQVGAVTFLTDASPAGAMMFV